MHILDGQVAIVTGGTSGLGWAIAREFASEGAIVVCASRSGQVIGDIPEVAAPGHLILDQVDVRNQRSTQDLVDRTIDQHGRLDIVVANAGVNRNATVAALAPDDWHAMLSTNLSGTLHTIQAAVPSMKRQRRGRIITVSSMMATRQARGTAGYACTKAAVQALTQVAAIELGKHGILVSCLAPGILDEGMGNAVLNSPVWAAYNEHIALRRPGEVHEAARAAVFLAGPDSTYLTGAILEVHGGLAWA